MSTETSHDDTLFQGPLYASAKKIYPQSVHGTYRRIKWAILIFALSVYYFLPFVRWDRGPNVPSQAVLADLSARRFYFFFIEIWPQEAYYFAGLLILAALILFLMNAVAGRVWCGYLCPQTVWTDLFFAIERWVEGDRRERMTKDAGPWTLQRARQRTIKYFLWLMVAWWTGGAWVLYFDDAPTLVGQLIHFQAPMAAYLWIGILTFTTFALAGFMREQVCVYMCPWPRIQAALTDDNALNITYRGDRGEPRMSTKKAQLARSEGKHVGECVDCHQCVAVCPTGVDIREGANLGCIQCGLCIDACDNVMKKVGYPPRLIAYDTDINGKRREQGLGNVYRLIRPRTILYAVLICAISGLMLTSLMTRHIESIAVIHDRNPLYIKLGSGAVRNGYTVRIGNKTGEAKQFAVKVTGLDDVDVEIIGDDGTASHMVEVGPDRTREVRLLVSTTYKLPPAASIPLSFELVGKDETIKAQDFFKGP